ncbi:hypothetical protein [Nocardia sp. NPDC051832]|uniref:hypothetical protein n=1 Tax=Nocardia sp. NPDC051832 TaxID=3155673 RepID=UPI003447394C
MEFGLSAVLVGVLIVVGVAAISVARNDRLGTWMYRTVKPVLALVCAAVLICLVLLALLYGGFLLVVFSAAA